jgi:hypothetical protein
MPLILLILRLLLGWISPTWNESVPLAVRRDGRLVNRLEPSEDATLGNQRLGNQSKGSPRATGLLSLLWRAIVRAVRSFSRGRVGPGGD